MLRWAEGSGVKKEVDLQVLELLGAKTPEELVGKKGTKKKAPPDQKKENVRPTEKRNQMNGTEVVIDDESILYST